MSLLYALDPGNKSTGWCMYRSWDKCIADKGDAPNEDILADLGKMGAEVIVVIESMTSYSKRVGRDVFDTLVWIGRMQQRAIDAGLKVELVTRKHAKGHVVGTIISGDGAIKAALIKAYGGKKIAIGTEESPGPLFGATSHQLAAIAVAKTYAETRMDTSPHGHTNT